MKLGDRVCALVAGGGYAELCVAPAGQCLPVPAGLSDIEAASLPETFFTVWQNVFQNAQLKTGETLLVQGGSSGIGVAAIHLAKAIGAAVIVTAGSDEKCVACLAQGADHAINYKTQDFVAEVKTLNEGPGRRCRARHGRRRLRGARDRMPGRRRPHRVDRGAGRHQGHARHGRGAAQACVDHRQHACGRRSVAYKTVIAQQLREQVWPRIEAGKIKPVIYKVFPAAQAAQAHALMESSVHVGKIVLDWSAS